jgi:hypothetical protein
MPMVNMSTKSLSPVLETALANIPPIFRSRLIKTYLDLKKNTTETRYEAAGLAAGKLCEVSIRLLQQKVLGSYTPFGTKINNFPDACRNLIAAPAISGHESERTVLPRALVFLYTMRNKRGIGHVGGDVDADPIDISVMGKVADWIICELIRINHGMSLEEAQDVIDAISVRQLPTIWEVAGKKRVLKQGLQARDQALLLLYSSQESAVLIEDLCDWIEYANPPRFRNDVIQKLHKERLLEFDKESESITLSPSGIKHVEEKLL